MHLFAKVLELGTFAIANGIPGHFMPRLFRKPVVILSPPRSGSSMLHSILHTAFGNLWGCRYENDGIWWKQFPYEKQRTTTDYIAAPEVNEQLAARIRRNCLQSALRTPSRWHFSARDLLAVNGEKRLLDKTIANAFHLEVLNRIYPEFQAIYLVREPRANFASMLEAWQSKNFMPRALRHEGNKVDGFWKFPIPPGWESVAGESLAKKCVWSLARHHEYILDWIAQNEQRVLTVHYEDFLDRPEPNLQRIESFFELDRTASEALVREKMALPSSSTVSVPDKNKWRRFENEIAEVSGELSRIAEIIPRR